jgi:hypothetical protein
VSLTPKVFDTLLVLLENSGCGEWRLFAVPKGES